MKYIWLILDIVRCAYSFSADPHLFGSKKRRKAKSSIASEFKTMAGETSDKLKELETQNPFETAAAKSAMTSARRGAKEMETRMLNVLGNQATPEAIIAAQGKTQEALGSAAGQIAVGAEAQKKTEEARLRGEQMGQMGTYAGIKSASEDERGSGWNTLFQGIDSLGNVASGVGQAVGVFTGS